MRSTISALALRRLNGASSAALIGKQQQSQQQQQRRTIDFETVDSQQKMSDKDVDRIVREREARAQLQDKYSGEDLEFQIRTMVDFNGNAVAAMRAVKAERADADAAAAAELAKTPTRVVFNPDMAAKLVQVKMEGGVVHDRARKKALELRKGGATSSSAAGQQQQRKGAAGAAPLDPSVQQYVYDNFGAGAADASSPQDAVDFLQSPSTTTAARGVVPSEFAAENLSASLESYVGKHEGGLASGVASDVPLELALKYIYEGRRNDPELVADAYESLTRTLYEKRYAGPQLVGEASIEHKFLRPGSPTAVLSSTRRDAELLGGDVIVNENLLGKLGVAEKAQSPREAAVYKKAAAAALEADMDASEDANLRELKPLSAFSARERKNYAKAVREMMWIEEWALQEIIIAFNDAEAKFEGTPEEYRAQLERVRDTIHSAVLNKVDEAVNERLAGKPLPYILGSAPFLDTEILCDPPVMCPRMETEHWVGWLTNTLSRVAIEELTPKPTIVDKGIEVLASNAAQIAISLRKNLFSEKGLLYNPDDYKKKFPTPEDPTLYAHNTMDVLDLCCGSGNIGIAIAKAIVGAKVVALDVLPEAVQLSRRNAMHNRIPKYKYRAEESDMFALIVHNALFRADAAEAEKRAAAAAAASAGKESGEGASVSSSSAPAPSSAVVPTSAAPSALASLFGGAAAATDSSAGAKYIPPLDQLPQIISENELHATMHFLSKAASQGGPAGDLAPLPVTYDLIVCNPPCVHPDDFKATVDANAGIEWESELAIVGDPRRRSAQQLYYRDLCILGHKFAKPIGLRPSWIPKTCPSIAFEVGIQGAVVANLFTQSKLWDNVTLHVDGDRMPRWITAVRRDFDW